MLTLPTVGQADIFITSLPHALPSPIDATVTPCSLVFSWNHLKSKELTDAGVL